MQQTGNTALMLLVVTDSFVMKTPAAATAWPVELIVLLCLELVVLMGLYVMRIPQKHVFSAEKKEIPAVVIIIYAVLIIFVVVVMKKYALTAIILVMAVLFRMNAVMVLIANLSLGKGGFVYNLK